MARAKVNRASPSLDMTPMVDLAFLLVTFFMLTTKFAAEEPIPVDMPSSVSELKLQEANIITVLMSNDGRVFFNMDNQIHRKNLLNKIGERYNLSFTEEQQVKFALLESFGMPVNGLKQYLDMEPEQRKLVEQTGIPADSTNNELANWLIYARGENPKARIAIKGDRNTPYPTLKKVIRTLQDKNVNRFNFITNMEKGKEG